MQGNHDAAVGSDAELPEMRDVAQCGVTFARKKLSPSQRAFLAGLPLTISEEGVEFVHASLIEPGQWRYINKVSAVQDHFASQTQRLSFCGHTHVPMMWNLSVAGAIEMMHGTGTMKLPAGEKTLINVGSVGQPRDLNPAACYVICHAAAGNIEFRRVPYDIARTRQKILRAKLPRYAAQRLALGR